MVPYPLEDADGFAATVEGFVNTLEVWAMVLREYRSGTDSAKDADAPDGMFGGEASETTAVILRPDSK